MRSKREKSLQATSPAQHSGYRWLQETSGARPATQCSHHHRMTSIINNNNWPLGGWLVILHSLNYVNHYQTQCCPNPTRAHYYYIKKKTAKVNDAKQGVFFKSQIPLMLYRPTTVSCLYDLYLGSF